MTSSRIISGVIFTIIFLLGLFQPAFHWLPPIIIVAGSIWGVIEFNHLGQTPPPRLQVFISILGAIVLIADGWFCSLRHGVPILGMLTIITIGLGLPMPGIDIAAIAGKSVIAAIYAGLPLAMITQIWVDNHHRDPAWPNKGSHYLLFLIMVTWASDIGAYFFGRAFGKHKLAPTLSPGKTIEGFLGGAILTFIVAAGAKLGWNNMNVLFTWLDVILIASVFSVLGPIGDLAESQLKRFAGKKDSGNTFTGHGGMLDIIDSLLFTTIFYYAYLSVVYPQVVFGGH